MTTEEEFVADLLSSFETNLPVDTAARARVEAGTLAIFDDVTASGVEEDLIDGGVIPELVVIGSNRSSAAKPSRAGYWLVAAASVVIAGIGASWLISDRSPVDFVSTVRDDDRGSDGNPDVGRPVSGADLVDGLEFGLPSGVKIESSSQGQMSFVKDLAGSEVGISVVRVSSWGEALKTDDVPFPGEVTSLRDWLAKSSTDQSDLAFIETNAAGETLEGWKVRLSEAGAVGCESAESCGVVAQSAGGQLVQLSVGGVTELISVEVGEATLLVWASYPEGQAVDGLIAEELARSISTGSS